MRLASVEKMGFYATPPVSQERIARFLTAERKGITRLLDPCAGEGVALKGMTDALRGQGANTESYGVELSDARAPLMRAVVDHGIMGDWGDVTMTNGILSLLYLNPPYDDDKLSTEERENGETSQRLEYKFLKNTIQKLAIGGVLVYIVPLHILQNRRYAGYISNNVRDISIYRLPGDEFNAYHQIVLFGYRRDIHSEDAKETIPTYEEELPKELPEYPQSTYVVPALRNQKITFRVDILAEEEVTARVRTSGAHTTRQWLQFRDARDESEFQPIIKLKVGHISKLITSGQMGVVELPDKLAVGRTSKKIETIIKGTYVNEDGDEVPNKVGIDRFVTTVSTINRNGEIKRITTSQGLEELLDQYGEQIGAIVAKKYEPLYMRPSDDEWRKMAALMKKKQLAGRAETGLFVAQKHVAIAMSRALDHDKWVILVGEMGTGKTATSLATASLRDQWPVLVMCPTHLTKKWVEEVSLVVPGAKGFVIKNLADLQKFAAEWRPGNKWVAVLSKENAKLTPGWVHAYQTKTIRHSVTTATGRTVSTWAKAIICPKCGRVVKDKEGHPLIAHGNSHEYLPEAGKERLVCTNLIEKWVGDPHDNTQGTKVKKGADDKEFTCGERLWRVDSTRQWEIEGQEPVIGGHQGFVEGGAWKEHGIRRWAIADYIHDKLNNLHKQRTDKFFKLLIADECHEFKGKDSAQAQAYHVLRDACDYSINLTGTIFNGKSTSLFWTLYRNDPEIRRLYQFSSETAWANTYGRLERSMKNDGEERESKTYSMKGKNANKAKEIPGISPAIYSRLLPHCIFLKKEDLNWKLPPYSEKIIRVDMGTEQAAQYNEMTQTLMKHVMDALTSRDKMYIKEGTRLLSTWLQRSLGRSDTGYRREMVIWKAHAGDGPNTHEPYTVRHAYDFAYDATHELEMLDDPDLPKCPLWQDPKYLEWREKHEDTNKWPMFLERVIGPDHILPKEAALAELVQEEIGHGHKFLVYVNQTGDNDIQPRIERILTAYGCRTQILPRYIKPENRAGWIERNEKDMDVLICNPEMVKTGLDLVMFNRIAYFEIPVKLETLQQSAARIYRIGQTRETKVYYFLYRGTMEAQFLALVSEKIKAAADLYGDSAASAIADENNTGDLARELAQRLMAGTTMDTDGFSSIMAPVITVDVEEEEWAEHQIETKIETQIETKEEEGVDPIIHLNQPTSYVRQSWMEFIEQQQAMPDKPRTKNNKKVSEEQLLLF